MMEIVRAESRDRARSTQTGIACELRCKPGAAVPELTMDGGPRIRAGLGDPGFSRPAPSGVLQPAARRPRRAPHRRRGRLRVHRSDKGICAKRAAETLWLMRKSL